MIFVWCHCSTNIAGIMPDLSGLSSCSPLQNNFVWCLLTVRPEFVLTSGRSDKLQSPKLITRWVLASSECYVNLEAPSTPWCFRKCNSCAGNSLHVLERFLLPLCRNIRSHICSATNQPEIISLLHLREKLIHSQKKSGVISISPTPESTLYAIRMNLSWVYPQEQDPLAISRGRYRGHIPFFFIHSIFMDLSQGLKPACYASSEKISRAMPVPWSTPIYLFFNRDLLGTTVISDGRLD